jgi:hypothetical protein
MKGILAENFFHFACNNSWRNQLSDKRNRFTNIGFEDFRQLAKDGSLSKYERIGFPDSYRKGREESIFEDVMGKLTVLNENKKIVFDIGPGCSDLPLMLISLCSNKKHSLVLIDNEEMLSHLPNEEFIEKVDALYPNCPDIIQKHKGKVDAILCYSVLHYILVDTAFFRFLDLSLSLLAVGGQFLIGDIPNVSKRKRFFASETGIKFHQEFMKTSDLPEYSESKIEHDQIDDAIIFSILLRARAQGFDAYVVPQNPALPMANRREDIIITRP